MMRTRTALLSLLTVVPVLAGAHQPLSAVQDNPAHTHVGHVTTGFPAAPDGQGLLPTLQAEIEIARQHIMLAMRDLSNLDWTQTHAAHALHALDPGEIEEGPGLGYGVVPAARGVAQHIGLAASSEGASDNIRTHATHIAAAAEAVADRAEEMVALAQRVATATDYATAEEYIERMYRLGNQLVAGVDLDGDGQIGWGAGEGGLEHVEQHVGLLLAGEGIE